MYMRWVKTEAFPGELASGLENTAIDSLSEFQHQLSFKKNSIPVPQFALLLVNYLDQQAFDSWKSPC